MFLIPLSAQSYSAKVDTIVDEDVRMTDAASYASAYGVTFKRRHAVSICRV
jgi:hypothetical protein